MAFLRVWSSGALLLLATGLRAEVSVHLSREGQGVYRVEGAFKVPATERAAWAVLTDYERISEFVSNLERSRVVQRDGPGVVVEQESSAQFLFFTRKFSVRLDIVENAPKRIEFTDAAKTDFDLYRGAWIVEPREGETEVKYRLWAKPKTPLPGGLIKRLFKGNVKGMLEQVRAEILKRSS
jgi:ribosome-associated toxin RatA of RatAB toxin-antitoxin module